jgi:tRNA nucleotidyltransferase/poly(A) polymerase
MTMTLKTPEKVREILKKFKLSGREIYIVGGVVRDIMLNRNLYDWDLTTNATPEEMLAMFGDAFYDNKYGTVGIPNNAPLTHSDLTPNPSPHFRRGENELVARPFEITTFRSEKGYSDSRHPDTVVWGKTLEDDLQRRDFTINAMALKPTGINKFEVIDLFGGMNDLKAGLIKTVGDPGQRFAEDALRMMRAVRIATQLRFAIDEETFRAIQVNAGNLRQISGERIRDELLKILASDYPADGYLLLRNCGIAEIILPEMEPAFGVEQKSPGRHHIYDVGTHSVEALRMCPSTDPVTRLATLIHDVGKIKTQRIYPDGRITFYNHEMESEKVAKQIADRLKFSNDQKDKFVRLVRWHQFTVDENQTDSAIRRFIRNTGLTNVTEMLALRTGDRLGGGARETSWRLEEFKKRLVEVQKQPFAIPDLKISGLDVMKIKQVPSGPMVGKYLQALFDEVTEKNLANEKEVLINRLKELQV